MSYPPGWAFLLLLIASGSLLADAGLPVPRFTDPQRRTRLASVFPEIEKIFERHRTRQHWPGVAFGVVIDGEVVLVKGIGVRDVKSEAPVTADTVFRIASMTKSFTAMAILKLRDEGKLSLEDPVQKWIPEFGLFRYPTADTGPIRIRQLLTHGAGFPEDNPWGDRQLATSEQTLTQWLAAGLPFSTVPDTHWEYSNYGFALLGRIVARASGMPYEAYMRKNILGPLGMRASTLEATSVLPVVLAQGYRREREEYIEEPSLPHGAFGSMGGMLTSANDLGTYVAYLLSAFPPRDDPERGPVRRSSLREMQQPWRQITFRVGRSSPTAFVRGASVFYGYGLNVSTDCQFRTIVGHGGGLPGFGSYMLWLPEQGVGLFAMANLTYAGMRAPIEEAVQVLWKTGALQPRTLPPVPLLQQTRDLIVSLWNEWNDAKMAQIAADSLFLDSPAVERARQIENLKQQVGACGKADDVKPENYLRGRFRMECEKGWVDVSFTLAPTSPPKLQYLQFRALKPPDEEKKDVATALAVAISAPLERTLAVLSSPTIDMDKLLRETAAVRQIYGACRVGEPLGGDGKFSATMRFDCDRGTLNVGMFFDSHGKLQDVAFGQPPETACVP